MLATTPAFPSVGADILATVCTVIILIDYFLGENVQPPRNCSYSRNVQTEPFILLKNALILSTKALICNSKVLEMSLRRHPNELRQ